jgi:DNA-binding FrmR family transcriptional regulator
MSFRVNRKRISQARGIDKKKSSSMICTPTPHGGGRIKRIMKNENAIKRLKTIEGHLKGISKMAENGEYCIDLIRQIQAVQGALNKVSAALLDDHLNSCVITAIRGDDISERERVLREIAEIYEQAAKV